MQVQCPKCKGWTDSENNDCSLCGAKIDEGATPNSQLTDDDLQFKVNWLNRKYKGYKHWQLILIYIVCIAFLVGLISLWLHIPGNSIH